MPNQPLELPAQAPVMVLPTMLFPHSLLPLYIFEPRYRAMLTGALDEQRVLCIALVKRGVEKWSSVADFHHVAGLGLVRACVGREDGTSHLVLQGLARVAFSGFTQEAPFPIAQIRELRSEPAVESETAMLVPKLLAACSELLQQGTGVPEALDDQLARIDNPGQLADVVAHTFLRDAYRRQEVIEELRVGERLRLLLRHLAAEMA